jgi:sarcosine oxidase
VPLLRRAFELWRQLESGFGEQLLIVTGSIDAGDEDHFVFRESKRSCDLHDIPHEVLDASNLMARYPAFKVPDRYKAVFQPDGGFIMSERAIVANVTGAIEAGAEIRGYEPMLSWTTTSTGVRVETAKGSYAAGQVIFSSGAWIGQHLSELQRVSVPERQVLGWFQPARPAFFSPGALPVFNLADGEERYYGFPIYGIPGFKFGKYHHLGEDVDPDHWERLPNQEDEDVLRAAVQRFFPDADGPVLTLASCMFTNTPDEHFIIDRLEPGSPVIVASPCSGHGYKFASVIGEILADLAINDHTDHNIDLFKRNRFAAA